MPSERRLCPKRVIAVDSNTEQTSLTRSLADVQIGLSVGPGRTAVITTLVCYTGLSPPAGSLSLPALQSIENVPFDESDVCIDELRAGECRRSYRVKVGVTSENTVAVRH